MVTDGAVIPFLWVGNHPATDLCNTEPVIHGERVELLPDFEAVMAWTAGAQVQTGVEPATVSSAEATTTLEFVRRLRTVTRAALESPITDRRPLDALNELLGAEWGALHVRPGAEDPISLTAADAGTQIRLDIAAAVLDIFRHERARVRRCANPACVLLFLDVSKSGRRRWCDMSTCGNRAKAAAHHARASNGAKAGGCRGESA